MAIPPVGFNDLQRADFPGQARFVLGLLRDPVGGFPRPDKANPLARRSPAFASDAAGRRRADRVPDGPRPPPAPPAPERHRARIRGPYGAALFIAPFARSVPPPFVPGGWPRPTPSGKQDGHRLAAEPPGLPSRFFDELTIAHPAPNGLATNRLDN